MPNRIVREGILTSEAVNALGWAEEVFYRRLLSVVDDFGRFYASPKLLRAACYPLHIDKVSDADIGKWLSACETAALVSVYPAPDGKRYLEVQRFNQQVRAKASKFPANAQQVPSTCVADAQQVQANAHLDGGGGGDVFEDEDVNTPPPPARAPAQGSEQKFAMHMGWKPSENFPTLARMAGITDASDHPAVGEFMAYWLGRADTMRTSHEWDHALVKSLKADKAREGTAPPSRKGRAGKQPESFAERDARKARDRWEQMTGRTHPDNLPKADDMTVDAPAKLLENHNGDL